MNKQQTLWKRMARSTRDAWCTALRSGKYKQAHGRLYDGEGFCCLGVLKHLEHNSQPQNWRNDELYSGIDNVLMAPCSFVGPASLAKSLFDLGSSLAKTLAYLNDGRKVLFSLHKYFSEEADVVVYEVCEPTTTVGALSFNEIADWIEANVPVREDIRVAEPAPEPVTAFFKNLMLEEV